jgi:hypothetical protein
VHSRGNDIVFQVAAVLLQVFGLQAGPTRDTAKHARANLFTVVEGEDKVRPFLARKGNPAIIPAQL